MTQTEGPVTGIARKKRSDIGIPRKSSMDSFCDTFRRMSESQQQTALEVLRQIQRLGFAVSAAEEEPKGDVDNG